MNSTLVLIKEPINFYKIVTWLYSDRQTSFLKVISLADDILICQEYRSDLSCITLSILVFTQGRQPHNNQAIEEAKQNTNAALDKQTADLKQTQDKVNQTRKDVNAVARDPVKAAATAVINQG